MLITLNFVLIPFHGPDDYDHVKRAFTLEHFEIWPANLSGHSSGGYIDSALAELIKAQQPAIFNWPRVGPLRSPIGAAPDMRAGLRWSGRNVYSQFPGAASYLPLIYAPQAAALAVGELLRLTVERSVFFARIVNGATAVAVVFLCLAYAPFGRNLILCLFLLPETISEFASNSADTLLHALTLVIVVLVARSLAGELILRTWHWAAIALCLLVLLGARPPMLAIALLPMWAAWRGRARVQFISLLVSVALALLWFVVVHPRIVDLRCGFTGTLIFKGFAFLSDGPLLIIR